MDENLTYDEIVAQQSGINDEEETTDEDQDVEETGEIDSTSDSDSEDSEESDDSKEEEEKEVPEVKAKKPNNGYARLLAERNAMKKELDAVKGLYESKSIEDIDLIATKRAEQMIEEKFFFRDNPEAQEVAEDILAVAKEHNMDVATAYKFHLAMTNPEALIDPQTVAKKESKKYSVSWTAKVVNNNKKTSDEDGYAQADAYYKSRD